MENVEPALAIIGAFGAYLLLKAVVHLYKTFLRPGRDLKKLGKWAVVTGATGKEISHQVYCNVSC